MVDPVVANRAQIRTVPSSLDLGGPGVGLPGGPSNRTAAALLAAGSPLTILLQQSRRLMVFATMEAALSVLVMSYISDLLSPALMLLSACVTFYGANQFSLRAVAASRPALGLNIIYHVYMVARLVDANEGTPFFDDDYTTARTVLLSLGCVVVMELVALKKAGLFYLSLQICSPVELDRLRAFRRSQIGVVQRFVVVVTFLLICAPVVARYLCQVGVC